MPYGDSFGKSATDFNLMDAAPNYGDTWQALFRESTLQTLGRTAIDKFYVDNSLGDGGPLTIEQANQEYGLKLKPTAKNSVSRGMAEYLQRQQTQSLIDQATIRQGQPDLIQGFGAGLAASLTDPAELTIEAILAIVDPPSVLASLGRWGYLGFKAGRVVKPAVATRWFARAGQGAAKMNPFLTGVIEGSGSSALMSPVMVHNSQALGRDYNFDDALMDVAVTGAAGGILHGLGSTLFRGRRNSRTSLGLEPRDEITMLKAKQDFNNGRPVDASKTIDKQQRLNDLAVERRNLTEEILRADRVERGEADPSPIPQEILDAPEVQRHTTALERRLLAITDPEGFRAELDLHAQRVAQNLAKLADLMNLPKADFLEAMDEAVTLQNEVLSDVAQLNEILPNDVAPIKTDVPLTQSGIFRKDTLKAMGAAIGNLNEIALRDLDDATKANILRKEFDRLRADLKRANQSLAQAKTKGSSTLQLHADKVAELTPQVYHAQRLLQALGEEAPAPELSFGDFIMSTLGGEVNPELDALLKNSPDLLDQPTYRVRKSIFDGLMRRLHETQEYLKTTDPGTVQPSRFPDNDHLLADVKRELADVGEEMDADAFHEKLFERVNQEIQARKALDIFSEDQLKRFDKIEEDFKANVEKTEGVKKGALQAQICALGGVTED